MNWIKGFFFGKVVNVQKYEETIKEYIDSIPKISFSENEDTRKFETLFEVLNSKKDTKESSENLKKLLEIFIEKNRSKSIVKVPFPLFELFSNHFNDFVQTMDSGKLIFQN